MALWVGLVVLVVSAGVLALAADNESFDTVDRQKIASNDRTRFIENVYWPSEEVIAAKRVPKESVGPDIAQLQSYLNLVLKKEFQPTREVVEAGVIAVEALRGGSDYLLLRYQSGEYDFQLEDGKALYILVTPRDSAQAPLDKVPEYFKSTAFAVLNIPTVDDDGKEPVVTVSKTDVGASHSGTFFFWAGYPLRYWYSSMGWWSDGRHVLIGKGKRSLDAALRGVDLSRVAAPSPSRAEAAAPRLFAYKKQ
jgi:hypothetical protein